MDVWSIVPTIVDQAQRAGTPRNLVTVSAVALGLLVLRSAWRKGENHTAVLVIGFLFCLASENVAIQLGKYHYSLFALSLPSFELRPLLERAESWHLIPRLVKCSDSFSESVPVEIAMLEGTLLYAVFRLTNLLSPQAPRTQFKWEWAWVAAVAVSLWTRLPNPLLNGFLAVSIDSILDPVVAGSLICPVNGPAHGVQGLLWTWHTTDYYQGHWFGIPLANYTAWFAALFAFTAAVRVGSHNTLAVVGFKVAGLKAFLVVMLLALLLFVIKIPIDLIMYNGFGGPIPTSPVWQFLITAIFPIGGIYGAIKIARRKRTVHQFEWATVAPIIFVFVYSMAVIVLDTGRPLSAWLIPLWFLTAAIAAIHATSPFRSRVRRPSPPLPPAGGRKIREGNNVSVG